MRAWKAPKKASSAPKKGSAPFQDFGTESLTGLTARLIGLSGCLAAAPEWFRSSDNSSWWLIIFSYLKTRKIMIFSFLKNEVLDMPLRFISHSISTTAGWHHWFALFCTSPQPCSGIQVDKILNDCKPRYWIQWHQIDNISDAISLNQIKKDWQNIRWFIVDKKGLRIKMSDAVGFLAVWLISDNISDAIILHQIC